MSEVVVVEIRRQLVGIKVIQSFNVVITTTRVETIIAPNTNVVKKGVVFGSIINLGHGSSGILVGRNLNRSLGLPIVNIGVVGTPPMVFTNPIMTTHMNRTTNNY
jgi:hypothetical protein